MPYKKKKMSSPKPKDDSKKREKAMKVAEAMKKKY